MLSHLRPALDPDISPAHVRFQAAHITKTRGVAKHQVEAG